MKKIYLFLAFLYPFLVSGQIDLDEPNYINPSPKAASLTKFGEIPVNYAVGAATTSIPLFNLQEQGIQLPISANYFFTGYRPTEGESELGYGWRLQAGCVISRTVHGLPDEGLRGFLTEGQNYGFTPTTQQVFDLARKTIDGEPDIFSFNFMGYSGKFFFGNDSMVHFVNQQPFTVDYTYITSDPDFPIGNNAIGSFTITTGDGMTFIFENYEASLSKISSSGPFIAGAINAWYLTKVVGTKGEEINFTYQRQSSGQNRVAFSSSQKKVLLTNISSNSVPVIHKNESLETYLTAIEGSLWKLSFEYTNHSRSLFNETDHWKLISSMKLMDKTKLGSPISQSYECTYNSSNRLLKRITEKGSDGSSLPPYSFSYNSEAVTQYVFSFSAIDLWGYLNDGFQNFNDGLLIPQAGARRNPTLAQSSIFALTKITYPTKAETTFEYELNDASFLRGNTFVREIITRKISRFEWTYNTTTSSWEFDTSTNDSTYITEDSKYNLSYDPYFELEQTFCGDEINKDIFARAAPYTVADFQPPPLCFSIQEGIAIADPNFVFGLEVEYFIQTTQGSGSPTNKKIPVGGVRIKKITYDAKEFNSPSTVYEYVYERFDDPGVSSGSVNSDIVTEIDVNVEYFRNSLQVIENGKIQYSQPWSPMALNPVEYSQVLELKNGKVFKKHYFTENTNTFSAKDEFGTTIAASAAAIFGYEDLFGPFDSFNYLRGLPSNTVSFDDTVITQKDEHTYYGKLFLLGQPERYRATAFYPEHLFTDPNGNPVYALKRYNLSSTWPRKTSSKTTVFDLTSGDSLITQTNYGYDNADHLQLTKTTLINSNEEEFETIVKYPLDYTGSIHSSFQFMNDSNYVTYPVEVQKYHRTSSGSPSTLVDAQVMTYQVKPITGGALSNLVLPYKTYGYNKHVTQSGFVAYDPISNDNTSSSYRPFHHYLSFNDKGNPTEITFREYQRYAFLWGYDNQRLIASVRNASFADLTSAITASGETVAGLTALTDPSVIASKLALIQVHSSLNNAHMTFQSFDSIYGLLQTTNPNGLKASVDYDAFGRLHLTKDHNENITSRTQYFYKP